MKQKKNTRKDLDVYLWIAMLLVAFQAGVYIKLCKWPSFDGVNLYLMLLGLLWPLLLVKVNNPQLFKFLFAAYLIFFAIMAGQFIEALFNPNVNCTGEIYVDLTEFNRA